MLRYHFAMPRAFTRTLATLVAVGVMLFIAPAAAADEAECLPTYLNQGSRELVRLDQSIIPPPLRGSGYDCASHTADWPTVFVDGSSVQYDLLYTDFSYAEFLDLLARFENTGWLGAARHSGSTWRRHPTRPCSRLTRRARWANRPNGPPSVSATSKPVATSSR